MKKLIFGGFAVFLMLTLITCDGLTQNEANNDDLIDVVYSADRGSLTIYLEGGVRQTASSRAMTPDIAKFGHDFYEVVFYVGATRVARASWELGDPVGVKNVPRNIDYTSTGSGAAGALAAPTSGEGYAVLFVGRKSDNTLLAVGKLTAVDGQAGTLITPTTTTVTFTVASLTAGARLLGNTSPDNAAISTDTFLTAAKYNSTTNDDYEEISADNTLVKNSKLGDVFFPMYTIVGYAAAANESGTPETAASYTIGSNGTATGAYLDAIRLAAPAASIPNATTSTKRLPRYPIGDKYNYAKWETYDQKTEVELTNNNSGAAGDIFNRTIEFVFKTEDAPAGVFAFFFQIPVFAISNAAPAGVAAPITWLIKPGMGTSLYDLDSGIGGTGGCILIGYKGGYDLIDVSNVYGW
jgi:hypothetical protein